MFQKDVKITAEQGFHTRPASKFVKAAKGYNADITVTANGKCVKATSLLRLQTLGLVKGSMMTLTAEGAQAEIAIENLVKLLAELQ